MNKKFKITNARLSFPSLFKKAVFNGVESKYEATLLIHTEDSVVKLMQEHIAELIKEAKIKVPADKICLKLGDSLAREECRGVYSLKASASSRPTILNRDKTPLAEEDNVLYAGCYVDAIIDFWVMNNNYGKRVCSNLLGVRFVKDGVAFGTANGDVTQLFDDLEPVKTDSKNNDFF